MAELNPQPQEPQVETEVPVQEAPTQSENELVGFATEAPEDFSQLPKTEEGTPTIRMDPVIVPKGVEDVAVLEAGEKQAVPVEEVSEELSVTQKVLSGLTGDVGLGVTRRKIPIKKMAEEDIARQMQPTLETKIQEAQEKGFTVIAGQEYAADELQYIAQDPDEKAGLEELIQYDFEVETTKPFVRSGQKYIPPTGSQTIDQAKDEIASYYNDIDMMMLPYLPEKELRQVVVNNLGRGVIDVTLQKLAEAGRGSVVGIPYIVNLVPAATSSAYEAWIEGKGTFGEQFAARGPELTGQFESINDFIEENAILGFGEGVTVGRAFNDSVRELLEKEVEEGRMTEDRFAELAFEFDPDTEQYVEREFFTDQQAQDLLNYMYEDLNTLGKIAATSADVVANFGSFGSQKAISAQVTRSTIRRIAKQNPDIVGEATDLALVARRLEEAGKLAGEKINPKILNYAIYMERVDQRIMNLEDDVIKAKRKLSNEIKNGTAPVGSSNRKYLEAQVEQSEATFIRANLASKVTPFFAGEMKRAGIITMTQFGARELLAADAGKDNGFDPQMAEFMGAMFGVTANRPLSWTAGTIKNLAREIATVPGSTRDPNFFSRTADFIVFGGMGVLNDKTVRNYDEFYFKPRNGRNMNAAEKRSLYEIIRIQKNSTQESRDAFYEQAVAFTEMRDRMLAFVRKQNPEGAEEFEAAMDAAFATVGQGTVMSALGRLDLSTFDTEAIRGKLTLENLGEYMDMRHVNFMESAVKNLRMMAEKNGYVGDIDLDQFVDSLQAGVVRYKEGVVADANRLNNQIDTIVETFGELSESEMTPEMLENMLEAKFLTSRVLGKDFNRMEDLNKMAEAAFSNLKNVQDVIKESRKDNEYFSRVSRNFENLIDLKDMLVSERRREIYEPVRNYFKNSRPIDMSGFVEEFVVRAGEDSIERFFSPVGSFFSGAQGRKVAKAMEDMVDKTIGKEGIRELRKAMIDNGMPAEQVRQYSNLQIALLAEKSGAAKVFQAVNGDEMDMLISTMKKYAQTTNKPELSKVATEIAKKLDDILENQDSEGFKELQKARSAYKRDSDRIRKGGLSDIAENNRSGPKREEVAALDATSYPLKQGGKTALEVFDSEIAGLLRKIMAKGGDDVLLTVALQEKIKRIANDFGAGDHGGRPYFDLDNMDANALGGRVMFDSLVGGLTALTTATLAVSDLKKLEEAVTLAEKLGGPRAKQAAKLANEYDFTRLRNIFEIDNAVSVLVKKDGEFFEVPLIALDEAYENAFNLSEAYVRFDEIAKTYDTALKNFRLEAKQLKDTINLETASLERQVYKKLEKSITGVVKTEKVYQDLITNLGLNFDDYAESAAQALVSSGIIKDIKLARRYSQTALRQIVLEGLMQRAGLSVKSDKSRFFTKKNKLTGEFEVVPAYEVKNPEQALVDLRDNKAKFVRIYGEEHYGFIYDVFNQIVATTRRAEGVRGNVQRQQTLAARLNKLYNVARGYVGLPYAAGDIAFRIAEDARIDLMKLIANDQNAARVTAQLLNGMPVSKKDLEEYGLSVQQYILREMAVMGLDISYHLDNVEREMKSNVETKDENE